MKSKAFAIENLTVRKFEYACEEVVAAHVIEPLPNIIICPTRHHDAPSAGMLCVSWKII
jgi:hypothetical protein